MPAFYNQASLSYNDITTKSNIVEGSFAEPLTISKTAIGESFSPDEAISYAISIVNSCEYCYTGLSICDDLGAYRHSCGMIVPLSYIDGSARCYVNGVLRDIDVTTGQNLNFNGITVPARGNALILYTVRVNQYAPQDSGASITNTATLSGCNLAAPISADATIDAVVGPRLTISKAICPCTVNCNEPLTYTLVIQNSGNTAAVAMDNVIVNDTFDPILNITEVRFNGALWSNPANYSYNSSTGLFTTAAGQITVPAASYSQNMTTGEWTITPGISTLTITGTLNGLG